MTNKEAKDLLQAYADYTTVPELGRALETAVRLIDRVEELEKELRDERDRFDRYADYSVERDRMIDQLKEDLRWCLRNGPCDYCTHRNEPVPCAGTVGEDFLLCWECNHKECHCHSCENASKWEWRGMKGESHETDL